MTIEQRIAARLDEIERAGLRRTLRPPEGIDLSSNDYLGLSNHPSIVSRMRDAIATEGCGSTGSRLLRGDRSSFRRVEQRFANFKGTAAALYFSSGYLANLSVLTTFPEKGDVIFSDSLNHASLIDGMRLSRAAREIFPHGDWAALERLVSRRSDARQKFIVTESLFSMDGDEAPLRRYARIAREHDCALIVDEAHAVGIYGERGSGLIEESGIEEDVFVSINTGGKALGVSGAFASGGAAAVEYLIQRARPFIFSTAPPPGVAAGLDAALDIVESEADRRATVLANAATLRRLLRARGIHVGDGRSQILSVIIGENEAAVEIAEEMQRRGFDVRAIRPPTVPPGTARLRVSVNVTLDVQTLERFADSLASVHRCAVSS